MSGKSNKIKPLHPGEILKEDFLEDYGLTQYALAKAIHIPQSRLSDIIKGKRGITADTAVRLARYYGTTPLFWLGLQSNYDLRMVDRAKIEGAITPHPVQPPSARPVAGEPPPFTPETLREAMKGIKVAAASKRPRRPARSAKAA